MKSSGICLISGRTSGSVARKFVGWSERGWLLLHHVIWMPEDKGQGQEHPGGFAFPG